MDLVLLAIGLFSAGEGVVICVFDLVREAIESGEEELLNGLEGNTLGDELLFELGSFCRWHSVESVDVVLNFRLLSKGDVNF